MLHAQNVAVAVASWELAYRLAQFLIDRLAHTPGFVLDASLMKKLKTCGPSYVIALVHALIMGARGSWHVLQLVKAPTAVQLAIPAPSDPLFAAAAATEKTNLLFFSWLLFDVVHIGVVFPTLGGLDMVAHHAGFMLASLVCGTHRLLPFAFAWLLCGELSTIPLNLRWLLIHTGRGESAALRLTNLTFAVLFFAARVVGYGAGLAHLWAVRAEVLALEERVARPLLLLVLALLVAGYALNLAWMRKIVHMATGRSRKRE